MPRRTGTFAIALAAALCAALPAAAAPTPALVKDINRLTIPASSNPRHFAALGGVALILVEEGRTNQGEVGVWRTDGTADGTFRLPVCGEGCFVTPRLLAVAGSRAFFTLRRQSNGEGDVEDEVWVSNGTPTGTFRLEGGLHLPLVEPPSAAWVASRGLFFFIAAARGQDSQLWRSDGTPAGTFRLTDLRNVGVDLGVYQGRVYFSADQGASAGALFRSDGTVRGTVLVKDPLPRAPNAPASFRVAGGKLVFLTFRSPTGHRLWCSDGTSRGTAVCSAFPDGTVLNFQGSAATASGRLFYYVIVPEQGVDVAVTDGTPQGTRIVTRIRSQNAFPGDPANTFPAAADGRSVFFLADDRVHGVELWKSDGTVAGTRMVQDVCPGACSGAATLGRTVGGLFFFAGQDETRGLEPWVSDGTAGGTRRIADLCPGACSSGPQFSTPALGSRLPFITTMNGAVQTWATDGSAAGTVQIATPADGLDFVFLPFAAPAAGAALLGAGKDREHGVELWRSDLTRRGTRFVADLNGTDRGGSNPFGFKAAGTTAYFFADDGLSGFELWKSDGTAGGTVQVVDAVPGPDPQPKPSFDRILGVDSQGRVYFLTLATPPTGYALWRTDGSAAGTFPLTDPEDLVCPPAFAELGGRSYFVLGDGEHGCELWSSDGTAAGTQVLDVIPGAFSLQPSGLIAAQGALYFRGFDQRGEELWRSDGTVAGTARVADAAPGGDFGIRSDPVELGGRIYFLATNGVDPITLWSSDGTEAGTGPVLPCSQAEGCRAIERLYKAGDRLWLNRTNDPGGESSLLASDGTPAGTVLLAEATIFPDSPPYPFQGRLYFSAINRTSGTQLWVSDGTAAGTRPFRGRRGAVVVLPESFVQLGARLFFLASPEGTNARFLWETDGTQAGTSVVPGVAPTGILGQVPPVVTLAGTPERLFLSAGDDAAGVELWGVTP